MTQQEVKEEIVECLIIHQPFIKKQLDKLKLTKEALLLTVDPIHRYDVNSQYETRIKQWVAFYVGDEIPTIPLEFILIEIEKIELEDYLNV